MKANKLIILLAAVLCMTGCGTLIGTINGTANYSTTNSNQNQTSVILSQGNFNVVNTVSASVSRIYVFGIGGLTQRALQQNALSKLYEQANLTGSQALININVHITTRTIIVWKQVTMTAHGTIVEFNDGDGNSAFRARGSRGVVLDLHQLNRNGAMEQFKSANDNNQLAVLTEVINQAEEAYQKAETIEDIYRLKDNLYTISLYADAANKSYSSVQSSLNSLSEKINNTIREYEK